MIIQQLKHAISEGGGAERIVVLQNGKNSLSSTGRDDRWSLAISKLINLITDPVQVDEGEESFQIEEPHEREHSETKRNSLGSLETGYVVRGGSLDRLKGSNG